MPDNQFHHHETGTVRTTSDVVHRDDAGMTERGGNSGFVNNDA
jgi:hypothetical protein